MNFDEVIQLQVLQLKAKNHGVGTTRLFESVIEKGETPELRQMCAKVSRELYDELETVTDLLGMSKREFIEGAVADGLRRASEAIKSFGAMDQGSL